MSDLSTSLQAHAHEAAQLEYRLEQALKETSRIRACVDGNIILVTKTGFSKPLHVEPVKTWTGNTFISRFPYTITEYCGQQVSFTMTDREDALGRRVYEQV